MCRFRVELASITESTKSRNRRGLVPQFMESEHGTNLLRGAAISMVQAADHWDRDHLAFLLDFSFNRRIPIQGKMCSMPVIVFEIRTKNAA